MKFVMLRAVQKITKVEYKGQIAINDEAYEDVTTSSDYWTVWADALRKWYDEVEIWYLADKEHKVGSFKHSTGLIERFWPEGYEGANEEPEVLFVRGDMREYYPLLSRFENAFKVYYPSGPYYCPNTDFQWGLCFVEDPRHIRTVEERTKAPVELFKKSCVAKYFRSTGTIEKKWDICFVCCAPIHKRKQLLLLRDILKKFQGKVSAIVIGLRDEALVEEFQGLPVSFTGWIQRPMMAGIMSLCKIGVVLSSSKQDGCPRVIQEFLAVGLPVVVHEETCCSSIYINKKTGVSASGDELLDAILDLRSMASFYDTNEFFRTSLSMSASVRHFIENMRKHGGPIEYGNKKKKATR